MSHSNRMCEGKGNAGKFIDRLPRICAAGSVSTQNETVASNLEHYLLKEEVDALLGDAIYPAEKPPLLPPLRKPPPLDMRHAALGDVAQLINPPNKSKFRSLIEDLKETTYRSYWNQGVGKRIDGTPIVPDNFDYTTTMGKKVVPDDRLYDIIMPKETIPEQIPKSKRAAIQLDRKYCKPPFNAETIKGKSNYPRGRLVKCCLTDNRVYKGDFNMKVIDRIEADQQERTCPAISKVFAPYNNIQAVPKGHAFGKVEPSLHNEDFLIDCKMNPDHETFLNCLTHLNSVRKCISKLQPPSFFRELYLNFKYYDKEKTGWLPKQKIYELCGSNLIRFDPKHMEPLLTMWHIFDGINIEYKPFVDVINYMLPSPELPKVEKINSKCLNYRTTYKDLTQPVLNIDNRGSAGLPSGRYFDLDFPITHDYGCKADRSCLQDESDVKSCLNPSILTNLQISHRDMFAVRETHEIRRIFEAIGETFPDNKFDVVWKESQKFHSKGKVCIETFRNALKLFNKT